MKHWISRRTFLKTQVHSALWIASAGIVLPAKTLLADATPDISVVKGKPGPATRSAVELLGGIKQFVKPGNKVVIKPNISFPSHHDKASNTHPEVIREVMTMCKEAGASRVRVLDNPLNNTALDFQETRDVCGKVYRNSVHLLSSQNFFKTAVIANGKKFKKTEVMKDVLEADVLISIPVAKSHSATGVSLSLKGMMGLIYNRGTMHRDYDLNEAIVDLASLLKPDLVVIDATRVLSTNGPFGPGKVIQMDTVIASRDMVAADAQTVKMCKWYGNHYQPRQIEHIKLAHERGLGRMDVDKLNVKTVSL